MKGMQLTGMQEKRKRQTGNLVFIVHPNTCSCFEKKRGTGTVANIETNTASSQAQPRLHAVQVHVIHTTNQTGNAKARPFFLQGPFVEESCEDCPQFLTESPKALPSFTCQTLAVLQSGYMRQGQLCCKSSLL